MRDPIEQRVIDDLDGLGADYEVIDCDPALADTAQFCEHYGYDPGESANAILIASKKPPGHNCVCLALADTRLDVNHKVRSLLGVRKLSFAPAGDAFYTATLTVGSSDLVNPLQTVELVGCSALDDNLVVDDETIDATESFDACSTITIGPAVEVTDTGRATFRARDGIKVLEIEVAPGGEAVMLNPGG